MSNPCRLDDTTQNKVAYGIGYEQGRADAIDEVILLARAEIDFESQAEQKRFVEFMEQMKEQNNES